MSRRIPRPASARRRMPFWDNARFACIVLVVLGHALQPMTGDAEAARVLYLVVFAFHMPAFAIISGYFSKAGAPGQRQMARVITDIVVPYLIFQGLWTLTKWIVEGSANPDPTQPSWTLWFLVALAIFRIVLPYLALVRWPLAWTVLVSVVAGYLPELDATFSLARALGLLPFFTLGWWLREHDIVARFGLLRRPWWLPMAAVGVFAGAAVAAAAFADLWRDVRLGRWMFYSFGYGALDVPQWWAGALRLALIAVALVLCAAFFALVPRRARGWTRFGRYTMYVYLLHSFVLYPFRESGVLDDLHPEWLWLPLVVVGSAALALGLASAPVRRVFRPLVEPRPAWLFADRTLADREGRRDDPTGARRPRDARHPDPRQNG